LRRFSAFTEAGRAPSRKWGVRKSGILLKEGMDVDLLIDANRSWSIDFIETVSSFLSEGGFVFYWDD
jgi:hypothetical protein